MTIMECQVEYECQKCQVPFHWSYEDFETGLKITHCPFCGSNSLKEVEVIEL
ncbi:MAG: hypothetical protein ACW99Q_19235 [Candidatus Kariarchaeaceae archaeon]|jgi:DNA-directed RNA polymerase subunit RPC12/RpoP